MKKLALLFAILVAVATLFTSSCKSEDTFNIVGTWTGTQYWNEDGSTNPVTITYSGTETAGSVNLDAVWGGVHHIATGTYTVTGLNVSMYMTWSASATHNCIGTANEAHNSINGTFTQSNNWSGTWVVSR